MGTPDPRRYGGACVRLHAVHEQVREVLRGGAAVYEGKRAMMQAALAAPLTMLATELLRIARLDRRTRDFTLNTLRYALAEVAAANGAFTVERAGR